MRTALVGALVVSLVGCAPHNPSSDAMNIYRPSRDHYAPDPKLALFTEVRRLAAAGHLSEAEARIRSLAADDIALWSVSAPNRDMTTFYDAGRELIFLLLAQSKTDEAAAYLSRLEVPDDNGGWDYDYHLAHAQILEAQGDWSDAEAIYRRLKVDFPRGGYGTFGGYFFMWEAEIDIGLAETLIAQSNAIDVQQTLAIWADVDLGKLAGRWTAAEAAALALST